MNDDQFLDGLRDRFDSAHTSTPGAASPPPDLWNRILADRNEGTVQAMNAPSMSGYEDVIVPYVPRSRRALRHETRFRPSFRRTYAAAAILLVMALVGGLFITDRRGPGNGDLRDLRYAAQPISPETSPVAAQACDIEPLTVEEVMAIVHDPYADMDYQRLNTAGFPDFLTDAYKALILPEGEGVPMEPRREEDARAVVAEYLRCRENGTMGQVFALMSPNKVQQHVLAPFPEFRSESEVRAYVEMMLPQPARDILHNPLFEMGITVVPAIAEDSALTFALYPDYPVAWIGTQGIDESGNVVAVSNAYGMMVEGRELPGPDRTFGAISVIQYPGVDHWYVHDDEVSFRTDQSPLQGTPRPEMCPVDPMTVETLLHLLDDPDAYVTSGLGAHALSSEGREVLAAIRDEPDSLVLASVTSATEPAMLVLPQEGVFPAAGRYLDCWQYGSTGQVFAFMSPHMIQEYDTLVRLPRDTGELQSLLDAPARALPASDRLMPTFVLDDGREVTVADTRDPQGFVTLPGGLEVAFIGTQMWDSMGSPIIDANVDDRSVAWADASYEEVDGRMSFGALTLIRYPGSDQWFVYDHWIELEPTPIS